MRAHPKQVLKLFLNNRVLLFNLCRTSHASACVFMFSEWTTIGLIKIWAVGMISKVLTLHRSVLNKSYEKQCRHLRLAEHQCCNQIITENASLATGRPFPAEAFCTRYIHACMVYYIYNLGILMSLIACNYSYIQLHVSTVTKHILTK